MSTLLALDTAYLYYRAFFGVPTSLRSPDGVPVNAVRGLLDTIARLVETHHPDLLACAWDDDWRPAWRVALVESYKANRLAVAAPGEPDVEDTPAELVPQVPIIKEVLGALGIAVLGAPGFEADDVLATLAARHRGETLVATGDRDMFQLIAPATRVVWLGRSSASGTVVDDAWLRETYGVPASRYVDFAVLRGDPSDGLPGVRGVGEKSAARLVGDYGSLAEILAAAARPGVLSPGLARNLVASADYISRASQVVAARADLPIYPGTATALPHPIGSDVTESLGARFGLGGSLTRLTAALAQRGECSR